MHKGINILDLCVPDMSSRLPLLDHPLAASSSLADKVRTQSIPASLLHEWLLGMRPRWRIYLGIHKQLIYYKFITWHRNQCGLLVFSTCTYVPSSNNGPQVYRDDSVPIYMFDQRILTKDYTYGTDKK